MTMLLQVRGLTKSFGTLRAVDGVSLAIGRGEAVGLTGANGSGKSTLAALIARLLDPDAGTILFDGIDLAAPPARRAAHQAWRGRVQMVFQDAGAALDPRILARDAVAAPLARLCGLRGAALTAAAEQALDMVGLERTLFDRRPHQLSGGQLARVGLARAVALRPDLLILDEPTTALDVSVQAAILHLLHALRRELGMALLLISHDAEVVRLLCERVLVMRHGQIPAATEPDGVRPSQEEIAPGH
jgi:ABC-type dipeptide/oligopeptide/nickel transport system ATPase subunit